MNWPRGSAASSLLSRWPLVGECTAISRPVGRAASPQGWEHASESVLRLTHIGTGRVLCPSGSVLSDAVRARRRNRCAVALQRCQLAWPMDKKSFLSAGRQNSRIHSGCGISPRRVCPTARTVLPRRPAKPPWHRIRRRDSEAVRGSRHHWRHARGGGICRLVHGGKRIAPSDSHAARRESFKGSQLPAPETVAGNGGSIRPLGPVGDSILELNWTASAGPGSGAASFGRPQFPRREITPHVGGDL